MPFEDTKSKLMNTASKLFGKFGFHKTSMDEVARLARKAKGSLYYYFSSKEELFYEVVAKEMAGLKESLNSIITNTKLPASEKFKQYMLRRMEVLKSATSYHETLKADFYEHFEFMDELRTDMDDFEKKSIRGIIQEGVDTGEFKPLQEVKVAAEVLHMVLKGLEVPLFIKGEYDKYSTYLPGLTGIVTNGLIK